MAAFTSSDDGFLQTMRALKLLFGLEAHPSDPFMTIGQFGFHGYHISVFEAHVQYLHSLGLTLVPDLPGFDSDAISRWKLVNELLIAGFAQSSPEAHQ